MRCAQCGAEISLKHPRGRFLCQAPVESSECPTHHHDFESVLTWLRTLRRQGTFDARIRLIFHGREIVKNAA